jgi:hypothetical protein
MKVNLKAALAGAVSLAFVGGGLLTLVAPAYAAGGTNPPYEPDANAAPPYGNIVFYNSAGAQVTSGTSLSSPFAYAVAVTAADSGANKATLYFTNPIHGENTALWTSTSEAGPTNFTSGTNIGAGTPTDIAAYAPTYPVVNASSADISTWLNSNTPDTTPGYANTIQVRIQDSGPGGAGNSGGATYWDADIAYNTTSSAITVDGDTVPADGWAQVWPIVTSTTTSLITSATGGHLTSGSPITLTATVPTGDAGSVLFYDNGTYLSSSTPSGGTATYTYTPGIGSHSYTASFVPTLGDESGTNSTTASIVGGSTSGAVAVTDSAPLIGTSTSLGASSSSIAYGASDTLTATVTESDSGSAGVAGSVQFFTGTTALGSPVTTTVSGTTGTAILNTTALPQGTDSVTATFTPTNSAYASSTSGAVSIVVAAPAACSLTGSSCSDTQNIQVTVNPGTITITTPYTASNPFVLPALQLSSDGTYLQSSATFPATTLPVASQIVVTSTLAGDPSWTLSLAATALSNGSGGTIPASGLGFTNEALLNTGTFPGTVTFTGVPALNPSPTDGTGTGPGLSTTPQTIATTPAGDGTAVMDGVLTLDASTATPAGTYTGTITFSVV